MVTGETLNYYEIFRKEKSKGEIILDLVKVIVTILVPHYLHVILFVFP